MAGRLRGLVRTYQDPLLAVALAAMGQVEIWLSDNALSDKLVYAPLMLAGAAALTWRRKAPVPVLAAVLVLGFLASLAIPSSGDDPLAAGIVLVVALYSVGAHADGRWAIAGGAAALVTVLLMTATDPDQATLGSYLFFTAVVGGPWLAGQAIRRRRASERQLEARAVGAEREREARARAAVADERARIARELHDVVADAISRRPTARPFRLPDDPPRATRSRGGRRGG
jgi:signal transduction histidine kinase